MSKTLCVQWIQAGETVTAGLTRFALVGANTTVETGTTEANLDRIIRDAGTFRNLLVRVSAITMTDSSTFTLRKGAADTALTVTITTSVGDYEDVSNSVAASGGDAVAWELTTGATGTSLAISLIAFEYDVTSTAATMIAAFSVGSANLSVASTTDYFFPVGQRNNSTTEGNQDWRVKNAATWSDLGFQTGTCSRTTDVTVRSRVEAANGNMTITATGADDNIFYEDTSNSDSLSADNDIDVSFTTGTGTGSWNVEWLTGSLLTSNSRFFLTVNGSAERFNAGVTRYWPVGGNMQNGEESTEANVQVGAPFAFTLRNLIAECTASTGVIDSTIRSRVNGANGNQVLSFVDGATGFVEDTSNTDSISAGNDLSTSLVTVNGTNVDFNQVGYLGEIAAAGTSGNWVIGSGILDSGILWSGVVR